MISTTTTLPKRKKREKRGNSNYYHRRLTKTPAQKSDIDMSSTSDSLCFLHLRHVLSKSVHSTLSPIPLSNLDLYISPTSRDCAWCHACGMIVRIGPCAIARCFRQRACWVGCLGLYKTCSSHPFAKCSPGLYVCGRVYMSGGRPAEGGGGRFGRNGGKEGKNLQSAARIVSNAPCARSRRMAVSLS